jgi:phage protein D
MANMFRADYYGWRAVDGLSKVTVRQQFSNHTLFFLDYNIAENQKYLLPPENTPLSVLLGSGPLGSRTMYGYVNHLEEKVTEQGVRLTRLVGVGTSKVMNTTVPSSWEGTTRPGVVRQLASRYRFRAVMHSHPEVLESWSTGSLTDFRALNRLAEEMGFKVWVDGATIWLLDPARSLAAASRVSTKVVHPAEQYSGQVFKGSNIPGRVTAAKRTLQYGISRTSNEVLVSANGDRSLPAELLTVPADTYSEAGYAADAARRLRADAYSVTATVVGDATLSPGAPVVFDRHTASPDQVGLWLVNSAEHTISADGFTTAITGTRDVDRPLKSRIPDTTRQRGNLTNAVIRNTRSWEAAVQEVLYV